MSERSAHDPHATETPPAVTPTIVLVHGGLVGVLGWEPVITRLQQEKYDVIAVENPLTSLDADVATTKRLIDAQSGPVVVVGHSYGGAVITGAAAGNPQVRALVYIAALAPAAAELVGAFLAEYPADMAPALVPDGAGFLAADRTQFRAVYAQDVPAEEAAVLAAAQKPIHGSVFGASVPAAAWTTIPSWYLVARQDHAINPALERRYATRMGATTVEIDSGHLPQRSHPDAVVRLIVTAVDASRADA